MAQRIITASLSRGLGGDGGFLTTDLYLGVVGDDTWASLADKFADEAYASVKGHVRTFVLHQQLLEQPATVLDVGGGAGHQSFLLAQAGYDVTLLDSSPAMLDKAQQRLPRLAGDAQRRVTLLPGDGENAVEAVNGAELDPGDSKQVAAAAAVELEASRRDPYRQLSRVIHLVGRKAPS